MSYILKQPLQKAQCHGEHRVHKMSAAFSSAYYDILSRDIRNVYGGVPPSEIRFRTTNYHLGIDFYERLRDQRTRSTIRLYPRKYMEYLESYRICIPRAPAFRNLSKSEIDTMVNRLNSKNEKASDYHHRMSHQHQDRSQLRSAPACGRVTSAIKTGIGKKGEHQQKHVTSKEHVSAIVERLYQGQTHQSITKQRDIVLPRIRIDEKIRRSKSAPSTGTREN